MEHTHSSMQHIFAQRKLLQDLRAELEKESHTFEDLILRYVEDGGTVIGVAKLLNLSRARVYVLLHRARDRREPSWVS